MQQPPSHHYFFFAVAPEKLSLGPVGWKYKTKIAEGHFVNWEKKNQQQTPQKNQAGQLSDSKFQSPQDPFQKYLQNNQSWKANTFSLMGSQRGLCTEMVADLGSSLTS